MSRLGPVGETPRVGEHADVLGASIGGLLTARVLADFYDRVSVADRDLLPESPANRRGVPQGHHVHNLLGRGSQILGELFPESSTSSLQPECPSTTTKMFRAGP
jgi:hypothetical protein